MPHYDGSGGALPCDNEERLLYGLDQGRGARTEEFAPAFEEAVAHKGASIIELRMDPEMITTRTTLSEIRRQAEARQTKRAEA